MPELPEIETIKRGIAPYLEGKRITQLIIRERRLRWPIPDDLATQVTGHIINTVTRRAKYLLIHLDHGTLILHLGMSGSVRIIPQNTPVTAHEHFDLILATGQCLRLRDPRRFGALLWHVGPIDIHPLLNELGPEPLSDDFTSSYLIKLATNRRVPIKTFIMNSKIIAGVGNIYASEALFMAGLHPLLPCNIIEPKQYTQLVIAIQQVLTQAIAQGGTTLRDYAQADGSLGYFANSLQVYGRNGYPCYQCNTIIETLRINQRASFFCPKCQPTSTQQELL